jgi:hypothetical protein
MVAHPLQLVGHVVERQQVAQVTGDRLLGGDRGRDHRRRLALDLVDPGVIEDHLERGLGIVGDQGVDRRPDLVLDLSAHAQDVVLDLVQLAIVDLPLGVSRDGRSHRRFRNAVHDRRQLVLELGSGARCVLFGHRRVPLSRTDRRRSPRSAGSPGW